MYETCKQDQVNDKHLVNNNLLSKDVYSKIRIKSIVKFFHFQ